MGFENVTIGKATFEQDLKLKPAGGILTVNSIHELIQAVGTLKHAAEPYERIYFRGQKKLHSGLRPVAYRGIENASEQNDRHRLIAGVLKKFQEQHPKTFSSINKKAHEPLLQHYGISTTWIDLVDNIWIALWFSLFEAYPFNNGRYVHFEPRRDADDEFGYILLIAVDETRRVKPVKGFLLGSNTETVDLRIAAPADFLRPHSQHGLLFRPKKNQKPDQGGFSRALDYLDHVRGILKYKTSNAYRWLGQGEAHSVRSLFPPPFHDHGYMTLLEADLGDDIIGRVHHVGA